VRPEFDIYAMENENAQKEMEHNSENVDDNDKQQPLERNKVNVEENDWIAVVYSDTFLVYICIGLIATI
jgi:hypothetical protein